MNDRTAEKLYVINAALDLESEQPVSFEIEREDSEYGTEAYFFKLEFKHEGHSYSAESYHISEAVHQLFKAAEDSGMLKDVIAG